MNERPQPLTLTDAAVERVKALIAGRKGETFGIRIGVKARGCSGLAYTLEFADAKNDFDEVIESNGVRVLIDPKASMFIFGTEMDFVEDKMTSGFVFRNPNEKGRCGCGESFHV
jgi:iron-sulfur cluster assembly protein